MSSLPERPPATEPPRHSYDDLFGDAPAEPRAAAPAEPTSYDDPVDSEPYLPPAARGPQPAEAADPPRVRAAKQVDTGRLYHSANADARDTGAIPAIPSAAAASAVPVPGPAPESAAEPAVPVRPATATPATGPADEPGPPTRAETASGASGASASAAAGALTATDRGLTYLGAIVLIGGPTLLVGLAQAIIANRISWPTGVVLLGTTIYAALTLRRSDLAAAVVVPPLAFLVTTLVAGQLTLPDGQSLLVREAFMIVRTLAEAAPWVLGAAVVGGGIALYRRRRPRTTAPGTSSTADPAAPGSSGPA